MIYTDLKHNEEIEPGDFVVYSSTNELYYGFYKGIGKGTIQLLHPNCIVHAHKNGGKPRVDAIFGQSKNWRVMKSHPDFVTRDRENLEKALEIIRETKILPVKY